MRKPLTETSLIIITRNRARLLERALQSLQGQTYPVEEIIVVDNGPSDATAEVARAFASSLPIRYVSESRPGYGVARNRGVKEAQGRIVLFLDDDCRPQPPWAQILVGELKAGTAEMVGGARVCTQKGLPSLLDYLSTDAPVLHPSRPRRPATHLSTSNLALLREVSERVGEFDETLVMCEDRDFCVRARKHGFRLFYLPEACVEHEPPIHTFRDYLVKMEHYGYGTAQYFLKHRNDERLARLFPPRPGWRLLLLPVYALLGTAYLVLKNLPYRPDAALLSPLLLFGQFSWHLGSYRAARQAVIPC